jgi:hypothetical protein
MAKSKAKANTKTKVSASRANSRPNSRRGESSAAARSATAEGRLTGVRTIACCLSVIFSDLASPAEAKNEDASGCHGLAQAGNRRPSQIKSGTGFFGIVL